MIFVGIDVASQKHDAVITRGQDDILVGPFTLSNDLDGFKKLRDEILSHTEHLEDVRIGIEETGIYSKNISEFLALCGFTVHKLNPVLTFNNRKAQSIRLTKTDKIDALAISRYVELNFKRLNSYTPTLYIYDEMKSLSRARMDVLKRLVVSKTEFVRLLDMVFPEFRRQFNPHSKWAYQLFSKHSSTDSISRMHLATLVDLIRVHGDRHKAASTLKTLAKNSIGNSNAVTEILFKNTLSDILHYQSQIDAFDAQIEKMILEHFPNLLTIPGVGPVIAALIVGEIGDVHRFKSPSSLVAYAGIDPVVHESGLFKAKNVHISKRGSRYLRTAIYTATKVACINPNIRDNKFRQKYAKKRLEGKHHNSAIFHSAKNMMNVIYALLLSGDDFDYAC